MKRIKNQSGFTLAETLLTVLILLLVSGIVATGMPAVQTAYEKIVISANAQAMLSTAITALRDNLGTAWNVKSVYDDKGNKDNTKIEYFDADTGAKAQISLDANGMIQLQNYISLRDDLIHDSTYEDTIGPNVYPLIPDTDSSRLYVTYESIQPSSADSNIIEITGLKVCRKGDDSKKPLAELGKDESDKPIVLKIRSLSDYVE